MNYIEKPLELMKSMENSHLPTKEGFLVGEIIVMEIQMSHFDFNGSGGGPGGSPCPITQCWGSTMAQQCNILFKDVAEKVKRVQFNDSALVQIIEFEDTEESKQYRRKFWEFCAVDRERFNYRIENCEETLNPILDTAHRDKIYQERILPYYIAQEQEEQLNSHPPGHLLAPKDDHDVVDCASSSSSSVSSSSGIGSSTSSISSPGHLSPSPHDHEDHVDIDVATSSRIGSSASPKSPTDAEISSGSKKKRRRNRNRRRKPKKS